MAISQAAQFADWMRRLGEHLSGRQPQLDLPLHTRGTAFQLEVWKYLQTIPYGEVRSYTEVAAAIGKPKAVRAVARACATNHVARSEEHTSELQSLMRISYAVFCLKKKNT